MKARLTDVRSEGENEFLKSLFEDYGAWLGSTDSATEDEWR